MRLWRIPLSAENSRAAPFATISSILSATCTTRLSGRKGTGPAISRGRPGDFPFRVCLKRPRLPSLWASGGRQVPPSLASGAAPAQARPARLSLPSFPPAKVGVFPHGAHRQGGCRSDGMAFRRAAPESCAGGGPKKKMPVDGSTGLLSCWRRGRDYCFHLINHGKALRFFYSVCVHV